jgi:uncharacterized protein YecT (DUF1311 family)
MFTNNRLGVFMREKTVVSIRDVDTDTFRKFKAKTALKGMKAGIALTEALRAWIEKKEKQTKKRGSFFDLKPWDWGKGNENASQEIDEVLYGGRT